MDPASAPFSLGEGPEACLLLHGLTGTPAEVRPLGEALAAAGYRAVAPVLPGHGSRPEDLLTVQATDLLEAVHEAALGLNGARKVHLCGLSMGALLSVHLAAHWSRRSGQPPLGGVVLMAPAIEFSGKSWWFTQLVGRLPDLGILIGKGGRDLSQPLPAGSAEGAYDRVAWSWAAQLRKLGVQALELAPRVRAPVLILHGENDRTVSPKGAQRLLAALGSVQKEMRVIPDSGHVLPLDRGGPAVCAAAVKFISEA